MSETKKGLEWKRFARLVEAHVDQYAVPQYGDYGSDGELMADMSAEECMKHIERYVKRFNSGMRGDVERERDLLKIAHFAGVAFSRLKP